MKFYFNSSANLEAIEAKKKFIQQYDQYKIEEADVIIPIGGDGFLLKNIHKYNELKKPFFGINYGSVGFLMNSKINNNLEYIVKNSQENILKPLEMKATNINKEIFYSTAYNEVSMMRQTHQAAKINIEINEIERMKELICDGLLVSTPAGSTAYNLSAHGPILNLDSRKLAVTPISPFRPRRWKGSIVSDKSKILIKNLDTDKRPISAVADNFEVRNAKTIKIQANKKISFELLYDKKNSLYKKIKIEQVRKETSNN